MGLSYNEKTKRREWLGSVRGLVSAVGDGDARLGFVVDVASGAKISMNISGADEPAEEPFYIESPDGQDIYDAYSRKEAVMILSNIRKGREYPDQPVPKAKYRVWSGGKTSRRGRVASSGIGTTR